SGLRSDARDRRDRAVGRPDPPLPQGRLRRLGAAPRRRRPGGHRQGLTGPPPRAQAGVAASLPARTSSSTSTLSRIAFEYGQTLCALCTRRSARSESSRGTSTLSATLIPNPGPSPVGPSPIRAVTLESLASSSLC